MLPKKIVSFSARLLILQSLITKLNTAAISQSFAERLWPGFAWFICMYFVTILVLNRFFYTLFALLALGVALVAVYSYRPRWDAELRALVWLLLTNLLLVLPNLILARDGLLSLENPVRMLLMLPMILAVMRFGFKARFINIGLAVGMLAAALVAGWQFHMLGLDRTGIYYNPIHFGSVAMSAFSVLLAACLVIRDRLALLYMAGLLAALYCVILSGSRGTLLAIVPITIFLLWWGWRRGVWKEKSSWRKILLFPIIFLFLGTVLVGTGNFLDRIQTAVNQSSDYFDGSDKIDGSDKRSGVSIRMELWRGALMAGREHPLLGIGYRDRENYLNQKILNGELKPYVANMHHTHNDYMYALQSRGVPGLILQILIYAVLISIFIRGLAGVTDEKLFAALAGILVTISYATYSLTAEPMFTGMTLIFFIVINSLCIGIIKFTKNSISADNTRQSG